MNHPEESGVCRVVDEDRSSELGSILHGIINAVAILSVNVEEIVEGSCDQTVLDDTRRTLERIVELAREAQRIRRQRIDELATG